uniref:DNA repair protein XRCC4 n=1 Tax=Cacopsylla melanoneura TaxID=428564 RepID=A0A8D8UTH3_9HEMI
MAKMETFICFLPTTDNGNKVQVKTTWDQSKITIAILDNNADTAWTGILPYSQLSQHHHSLNISEQVHRDKCKEVLSTNQGVQGFSYHLENDCFIWKKKILTDMKIKFGQIDVQKVPVSQVRNEIMMALISKVEILESKSKTDEEKIRKLESENTDLVQTLEEFTQLKLCEEQILYGKFTALLNTKKQRVACLEKMMFKNLCLDAEESKAGDNRQQCPEEEETNWNEDTDPEDESMDPVPGPSGIRISTVICEDTDDEDNDPNRSLSDDDPGPSTSSRTKSPVQKRSPIPSTSGYSCKMIDSRQPSKTSHEDLETVPMKKVKLTPDMSGATEMGTTRQTGERKKLPKPVSEMDSQELLDLL